VNDTPLVQVSNTIEYFLNFCLALVDVIIVEFDDCMEKQIGTFFSKIAIAMFFFL
jgi:hypothetical protein